MAYQNGTHLTTINNVLVRVYYYFEKYEEFEQEYEDFGIEKIDLVNREGEKVRTLHSDVLEMLEDETHGRIHEEVQAKDKHLSK